MTLRLYIVVDNEPSLARTELLPGWGLSIYVDLGDYAILFDTGHDEKTFRNNVKELELDLSRIRAVVISHEHGDHTGGLGAVLDYCKNFTIYLPAPSRLAQDLMNLCRVELNTEQIKLADNIYLINFAKRSLIPEQIMVIDLQPGIVVITGCSHPGIEHIVRTCMGLFKKDILLLIGGFHLFPLSDREIDRLADRFCRMTGLRKICPLHCSGPKFKRYLESRCPDRYVPAATGSVVEVSDTGEVRSRVAV